MTARTGHDKHHVYGQDNFLAVCWIRQFDEGVKGGVSPWWWGLFNVPVGCVYAFMLFALVRVSRRLRQGLPASLSVRRSSLSAGRLYLTAYALYWTLSGVFYLVCFTMNKDDPPLQFLIVFAGMFGLRGVVTLLVWVRSDEYRMLTKAWTASSILAGFRRKKRLLLQQHGYGSDAGSMLTPRQWALEDDASAVSDASVLPGGTALNDFASIMQPKGVQGGEAGDDGPTSQHFGAIHLGASAQAAPPRKASTGSLGSASTMSTIDSAAVGPDALESLHSRRAVNRWRAVHTPDLRPHLNVALRKEMLFYTTLGIRIAAAVQHAAVAATPESHHAPLHRVRRTQLASSVARVAIQLPRRHEIQGWSAAVAASAAAAAAREEQRWHAALTALAHDTSPPPAMASASLSARDLLEGGAGGLHVPVRGSANGSASPLRGPIHGPSQSLGALPTVQLGSSPPGSPAVAGLGSSPPRSGGTPLLRGFGGPQALYVHHKAKAVQQPARPFLRRNERASSDWRRSGPAHQNSSRSRGSASSQGVSGGGAAGTPMQQLLMLLEGEGVVTVAQEGGGASPVPPPLTREERLYGRRGGVAAADAAAPLGLSPALQVALPTVQSPTARRGRMGRSAACLPCLGGSTDEACFEFLDYAPDVFARIRAVSGVSDEEYITALEHTKREKFSEGASGAFLYFSADERYIVKTMTSSERTVLLGMLGPYARHLADNPGALLTRFLGCHTLVMYGTHMHFMVMKNVLHTAGTSIQERYDLKGSWVQRHRVPLERGARTKCRYCRQQFTVGAPRVDSMCPARPNRTHVANTVLKDNDMNTKLHLPYTQTQALGRQLVADAVFLSGQGIMDYSLLVGVHRSRFRLAPPDDGPGAGAAGIDHHHGATLDTAGGDSVPAYDAEARSLAHAAASRLDAERAARLGMPTPRHLHGPTKTPHWGLTHDGMEQPGMWGNSAFGTPAVSEYDLELGMGREGDAQSQRDERDFEPDEVDAGVQEEQGGAEGPGGGGAGGGSAPVDIARPPRLRVARGGGSGWSGSDQRTMSGSLNGGGSLRPPQAGWGSLPGGVARGVGSHAAVSTAFDRLRQGVQSTRAVTSEAHGPTRGRRDSTGATLFTGDGGGAAVYVEEHMDGGTAMPARQSSAGSLLHGISVSGSLPGSPRKRSGWTSAQPPLDFEAGGGVPDIESVRMLSGMTDMEHAGHMPTGSASVVDTVVPPPPGTAAAAAGGSHATADGGLRPAVVEAPSIYYIGIIDVLQEWTWHKWAERWLKVVFLWRASTGVSAIPPDEYAERFRARVVSQLLDGFVDGDVHPEHPRYAPFLG